MADNRKRLQRFDLKSADGRSGRTVVIAGTVIVAIFAVVVVFAVMKSQHAKQDGAASLTGSGDTVRVASSKLVTQPGTHDPKVVVSFYEDFLCPGCGDFERSFGPTVSKLIDIGAIAADYSVVSILDHPRNHNYPSRAGAASLCVADESMDAYRRFRAALYSRNFQPSELASSFPDNAKLIEIAREAGVVGKVPDCITSGKYLAKVAAEAALAKISATPTIKINDDEYDPLTPDALVAKIKAIVGAVPGIDMAVTATTTS
ncbi:DsbA family protein [Mycobacterium lepromatosis]|uniref:DsbA family protein n=1 Tax=Mycobacterium lepromatosis TaxID=480418 RepID=UPI0005F79C93|nr:DsbA family protein [Mycobacterium lepromatosis]UKN41942.1 membrane protein [Mycobacterium lepromatosis]